MHSPTAQFVAAELAAAVAPAPANTTPLELDTISFPPGYRQRGRLRGLRSSCLSSSREGVQRCTSFLFPGSAPIRHS